MSWLIGEVYWVTTLGYYHVVIFAIVVPLLALRGRNKLAQTEAPINRLNHFRSTSVMLALFGSLSVLTAAGHELSLFHIDGRRFLVALPAGLLLYGVAVVFMRPRWRKAVAERKRVVRLFMPETAAERNWWFVVSILAGVSEEITWRGVQSTLLAALIGSPHLAVALCAAMFGAAHVTQGWKSVGIVAVFGLGFQALVLISGSLYLPMLVHAVYDITAGLTYGKLGREQGLAILFPWPTPTTTSG